MNRRQFLIASGATGAAAAAVGATGVTWQHLMSSAQSRPLPAGQQVLVVLTMYGGNDGLNTFVPYADPAYHSARPELAYADSQVLRLDDQYGLNPSMAGFAKLWQDRKLAIVRGVGYPQPDHSHFRSMDIWQTASPQAPVNTGWIGRWLDATGDDPLRAVNIGAVLPPLAMGARATAAALPLGKRRTVPTALSHAMTGLAQPDPADSPSRRWSVPATGPTSRWTRASPRCWTRTAPTRAPTSNRRPARPAVRAAWPTSSTWWRGASPPASDPGVLGQPGRLRHPRR